MADLELPKKVLFIDHDPAVAESLASGLRNYGINLVRALESQSALYNFNQQIFEVAVIEMELPQLPGLALAQKFRGHESKERRQIGLILISAQNRQATDDALLSEMGDIEIIAKPINPPKLLAALGKALARRKLLAEMDEVEKVCYDKLNAKNADIGAAIDYLSQRLPKLPKRAQSLYLDLLEQGGRNDDALKLCDDRLKANPSDIVTLNAKGRMLLRLGRHAEAKAALEAADKAAPKNLDRINAMSEMYLKLGAPEKSISKMRELIDLSPEAPDIKFEMFKKLETFGFPDHALSFTRDTTPPAEVVRFYNNKGVALAKGESAGEAVAEYERALKVYPKHRENYRILFNLALAYAADKSVEATNKALDAIGRCLELKPDFDKAKSLKEQLAKRGEALSKKKAG